MKNLFKGISTLMVLVGKKQSYYYVIILCQMSPFQIWKKEI